MTLYLKVFLTLLFFSFCLPFVTNAQHYSDPDSAYITSQRSGMLLTELDLRVNEIMAVNNSTIADENGEFHDWIEIHNFGDEAVNLNGLYITDNIDDPTKHLFQEVVSGDLLIPANGYIVLWADNEEEEQASNHLNFTLSGSGEYVGIYTADGLIIDGVEFGQQISDVSYGRNADGDEWNYFSTPTPNAFNGDGLMSLLPTPVFSNNEAFINGTTSISISVAEAGATIYYTLNGAEPTAGDAVYTEPVVIESTTMLRAKAFKTDHLSSRIATNTFISAEDFGLDIISLTADNSNWFGTEGIYDNRYTGIEKQLHVEYFNNQGILQFEIDGGVKIHAPDSRPQQSLRLYFRSEYGDSEIDYPLFAEKDITNFKRLVLRNAGNDGQQTTRTHFRDVLCHDIFREMDSDNIYAAYKPVNVYLNGEYWGIYNLRERQDKYFAEENFGTADIDFLERTAETGTSRNAIEGDWENYDEMKTFIIDNDLSEPTNYEFAETLMDMRNYVDYMVTEIWTANRDWLSNNIKFYRPRNIDQAKWKWVLWDTEYGMGCYPANDHGNPNFDALHMSMSWGGWPPHWGINSTYLMQNLTANQEFTDYFITRHADLLNSYLREDRVLEKIQEWKAVYENDMPKQIDRWSGSMGAWNGTITIFNNWVSGNGWGMSRNAHCRQHIINKFDYVTDEHIITLNILPANAGFIKVNTIQTDENTWSGYYFEGVPVELTAIAYPGFEFTEWVEPSLNNPNLEVWMTSDSVLTALFEVSEIQPEVVVINEINYNSPPWADAEDWVELTNPGSMSILLEGWTFKDSDDNNIFEFPQGTILNPNDFLILCRNDVMFSLINPTINNVIGSFDFGLSNNGELIRLYNPSGDLVDQVTYNDVFPWPANADGTGSTLELINPSLDNALAENWFAREATGGSPGFSNDTITTVFEMASQEAIYVYPNPFNNHLNFRIPNAEIAEIKIMDTFGRTVLVSANISDGQSISLSDLASGMYLLQTTIKGKTPQTIRLIKN
jgi:hypothetical protein